MRSRPCTAKVIRLGLPRHRVAVLALLLGLGSPWLPAVAPAATTSFPAVADASVWAASPGDNYNFENDILVGPESGGKWYSYMKFAPSGIASGTVTGATMRVRVHGRSYLDDNSQDIHID